MEHIEFIRLVKEMRDSQKKFFDKRQSFDLSKSKKLEVKVDDEIKKLLPESFEPTQQAKLFDEL